MAPPFFRRSDMNKMEIKELPERKYADEIRLNGTHFCLVEFPRDVPIVEMDKAVKAYNLIEEQGGFDETASVLAWYNENIQLARDAIGIIADNGGYNGVKRKMEIADTNNNWIENMYQNWRGDRENITFYDYLMQMMNPAPQNIVGDLKPGDKFKYRNFEDREVEGVRIEGMDCNRERTPMVAYVSEDYIVHFVVKSTPCEIVKEK